MAVFESDAVVINHLRSTGMVDAAGLERARATQKTRGGSVVDALLRLNLVREADFLRTFAELYSTRFVKSEKLSAFKPDEALLNKINVRTAERLRMCPIRWDAATQQVLVVVTPPLGATLDMEARDLTRAKSVVFYMATPGAVNALIRAAYYRHPDAFADLTPNGAGAPFPDELALSAAEVPHQEPTVLAPAPTGPTRSTATVPAARDPSLPRDDDPPEPTRDGTQPAAREPTRPEDQTIAALRRELARYRIAQEFHRRVAQESNLAAMVDRILSVIFELLPAEGSAIWLQNGQYAAKARQGTKKIEVPRAVIDEVLQSPDGILVHNALVDERFDRSASVMVRGIQSVMAVPLRTPRSGTLGILYVESISSQTAFSEGDLPLLDAIGTQAAILLDNAALMAQVRKEVENRVRLQRFLSPAAAEEVLSGRLNLRMEGRAAEITVLFADIRGFTTLSSRMQPEDVVRFLNLFFGEMVESVERHGGIVDKFIGDCVMAQWGALDQRADHSRAAVMCALDMVERAQLIRVEGRPLGVGVGLNTGVAVVGAIGSKLRLDYTAIGSTVNLAARLCGLADVGEVLVSEATLRGAGSGVQSEPGEPVILKGIDGLVVPHRVHRVSGR